MAQGANRADAFRLITGSGLKLTISGVMICIAVTLAAGRVIRSSLYGLEPFDPPSLGGSLRDSRRSRAPRWLDTFAKGVRHEPFHCHAGLALTPSILKKVKPTMAILRWTLAASVAVALGVTACAPQQTTKASVKDEKVRKVAPNFTLKDAHGKAVKLSDFKGKVVLLDFWATWCGPCQIEIPWFTEFQRKYKDRGFEVVGVAMDDEGWKVINPFVKEKKINYRILLGDDATGSLYGGVDALPTTLVIDREGRIASVHVGLSSKGDFSDAIEKLLEAPASHAGKRARRTDES